MPRHRTLVDQPCGVDPHDVVDLDPGDGVDRHDITHRLDPPGGAVDGDPLAHLRPPPPRTWRERLDDLTADPPPAGRVALALAAVVVVAFVAWRALAPTPGPPEMDLPLAEPMATGAGSAAVGDSGAAQPGAGVPGSVGGDPAGGATQGATAPAEVVVHVVGAVAAPGVQRLPAGARVVDAIEAAGGAAPGADLARVNLAAVLVDGQQVVVLRPGEAPPGPLPVGPPAAGPTGAAAGEGGGPVDINTASASQLEDLPGVGPATAEAIVAHRAANGPFTSVDDLLDVRGIGEAKLAQIRPRATV